VSRAATDADAPGVAREASRHEGLTRSREGVVTGNTYDKYGSRNPLARRLMGGFERDLDALLRLADPSSVLDVGCGEGVLVQRWAALLHGKRMVGVDLEEESLQAGWSARAAPNLQFVVGSAERLPFADGEFDLVSAIEVLEHVADPARALAEMRRCAQHHLLVSVPREPLWRALNMMRGAYWRELGNTPGHLNHWSRGAFVRLLARQGAVAEVRSPLPWTLVLVRI
jgi:2-polyprenyl-3-methyl-5-hydroxy-6-metoxy-1,4-benzoquinol methylase